MTAPGAADGAALGRLERDLQRWVEAGLLSGAQAAGIAEAEGLDPTPFAQAPHDEAATPSDGPSVVVEALGYLGGVIVVVAGMLLAGLYWQQASTGVRLVLTGGAAGFLLVTGQLVPEGRGAAGRLGSVLWVASLAATAGFSVLLSNQGWNFSDEDAALFVAVVVSALAGLQWWRRPVLPQQVALVVTLVFLAVTLTGRLNDPDQLPGIAAWGVGLVWFILGAGSVLVPTRPVLVLSSALMLLGSLTTISADAGLVFALATAAIVAGIAIVTGDLIVLAIGAIGWLVALPTAVTTWLPGRLSAPLALLAVGATLIAAAIRIARRKHRRATMSSRLPGYGDLAPATALRLAAVATLVCAAAIVLLSL